MTPDQKREALEVGSGLLHDLQVAFPRDDLRLGYVQRAARLLIELVATDPTVPTNRRGPLIPVVPIGVIPVTIPLPCTACEGERTGCFKLNYGFAPHPRRCKRETP